MSSQFRLVAVAILAVLLFAGTVCRADDSSKKNLPAYLKKLLHATTFDDQVRGEGGLSANYAAYCEAREKIVAIEVADLEWLRARASPAGRLYAAVLMKESGKISDEEAFGKLLKDTARVQYLSGCKGMETTVKEVAAQFMKEGRFMNFQMSMFCKLKTQQK